MTPDDSLERELESYRPRPPSPALRRRIGRRLDRPWRLRFSAAVAAAAAAAALIFVSVSYRSPPGPTARPAVEPVTTPTVLAYERAFDRSPADLDGLLDEQAVRSSERSASAHAGAGLRILALNGS
jgi:hypothetical protein